MGMLTLKENTLQDRISGNNNSNNAWFVGKDDKPFFTLNAYSRAFGIPFGRVLGASLFIFTALPREGLSRASHFVLSNPRDQALEPLPLAVDDAVFVVLNRLLQADFYIKPQLIANILSTLELR
jgi:hypothetical protein